MWLDAGIVPFSTLGWESPEYVEQGYATGAAKGLTTADLPDHAYWDDWFPADWVSEMREQIRLWFYSQLFMSVALVDRAPFREVLGYEKMLDEHGREMHGSWGNMIDAEDAFARMGADVMRWQFCAQPPDRNLLFGYGPAHEIKKKLLTLWNSVRFLVDYGNIQGFTPSYADLDEPPLADGARALDRWLVARTQQYVHDATQALDDQLTYRLVEGFDEFVDEVSNWYIRRSRRRFWDGDEAALRVLWYALVQGIRAVSPVMPFLAEHLWCSLVRNVRGRSRKRVPRRLAAGGRAGLGAVGGDRGGAGNRRPGPPRSGLGRNQVAPASQGPRRRRRRARHRPRRRDRRGASRQVDLLRADRRRDGAREAQPEAARAKLAPSSRRSARRLPRAASSSFRRRRAGRRARARPDEVFVQREAPRAGRWRRAPGWRSCSTSALTRSSSSRAASTTLVHTGTRCARRRARDHRSHRLTLPDGEDLQRFADWIKSETLAVEIERGAELAVRKA